jgi:hypothetical protein
VPFEMFYIHVTITVNQFHMVSFDLLENYINNIKLQFFQLRIGEAAQRVMSFDRTGKNTHKHKNSTETFNY